MHYNTYYVSQYFSIPSVVVPERPWDVMKKYIINNGLMGLFFGTLRLHTMYLRFFFIPMIFIQITTVYYKTEVIQDNYTTLTV